MLKPSNAPVCSPQLSSTDVTLASGGPFRRYASNSASFSFSPSATTRIEPSFAFPTAPMSVSARARRATPSRKKTPCTSPRTVASSRFSIASSVPACLDFVHAYQAGSVLRLDSREVEIRSERTHTTNARGEFRLFRAMWAISSVGRAVLLHSKGRRFESCIAHHNKSPERGFCVLCLRRVST